MKLIHTHLEAHLKLCGIHTFLIGKHSHLSGTDMTYQALTKAMPPQLTGKHNCLHKQTNIHT